MRNSEYFRVFLEFLGRFLSLYRFLVYFRFLEFLVFLSQVFLSRSKSWPKHGMEIREEMGPRPSSEAKDHKIPDSDQEFYFWNRNTKYGDGEINWKSHTKHGYYETPCKFDMDTLECAIIPVIPEVKVLPIKTKK